MEYIAARSSKLLSLHKGKFLVEKRLQALDFVLSPSQKETPQDGSYMFHCLQDQIQYNPILQDYSENALQLRWKICQYYGFDMTIEQADLGPAWNSQHSESPVSTRDLV